LKSGPPKETAVGEHTPEKRWSIDHEGDELLLIDEAHGFAIAAMRGSPEECAENAVLAASAPSLLAALRALSDMYTHAWDRTDGALVMSGSSVPKFEAVHEAARSAIQAATGAKT
jgi:hypothetical protein